MPGTANVGAGDVAPKRIWLVAVLFGLVSSAILATIVVLATRSSTAGSAARPTVAIVGDSITDQGESALKAGLSGDWSLRIDGRSGFTIAMQLPAAKALAAGDPSQVVINLGTNDAYRGDLEQSVADLAAVVALFPDADCVHLVTVTEGLEVDEVSYGAAAAELNRTMAALAAADRRVHVIDWSAVVAADDGVPQPDGPILADSAHPTPRGQQLLAGLYADALASCPAGG